MILKETERLSTAQSVHAHTRTHKRQEYDRRLFHKALFFEDDYLDIGERPDC